MENTRDMMAKGRALFGGTQWTKTDVERARDLARLKVPQAEISSWLNIPRRTIRRFLTQQYVVA